MATWTVRLPNKLGIKKNVPDGQYFIGQLGNELYKRESQLCATIEIKAGHTENVVSHLFPVQIEFLMRNGQIVFDEKVDAWTPDTRNVYWLIPKDA